MYPHRDDGGNCGIHCVYLRKGSLIRKTNNDLAIVIYTARYYL